MLFERVFPISFAPVYGAAALAAALPFLIKPNPQLLNSGTYYVAEEEEAGRLLAAGGWTRERPGTTEIIPGLGHLRHFATDPSVIRRGIGRAIFRECAVQAMALGTTTFQVYSSLNAVDFYKELGLTPVRSMELFLGPTVSMPVLVMEGAIRTG